MKPLTLVIPGKEQRYAVAFPEGFGELEEQLKAQIGNRKVLVIVDAGVAPHVPFLGNFPNVLEIPSGEDHKTWDTVESILGKAFELGLGRDAVFVGLGGGVLGDMVVLASGLFMRGVPCVLVPTTLLAMVDASIGGKGGVDCKFGKNLIGLIHQPEAVLCCGVFLKTLPARQLQNGVAEMIKHGLIGSPQHLEHLKAIASPTPDGKKLFELVPDSIQIKAQIVEQDANEQGKRMWLNLGHTYGHAIELLSEFGIDHGLAVAMGTVLAAEEAARRRLCDESLVTEIRDAFTAWGVDTTCPYPLADVEAAMIHDKKARNGVVQLVLPTRVGEVVVVGK